MHIFFLKEGEGEPYPLMADKIGVLDKGFVVVGVINQRDKGARLLSHLARESETATEGLENIASAAYKLGLLHGRKTSKKKVRTK